MVVSGVTLAAAAKLAGAGGSGAAAWLVWRSMPDQVFRRKLMHLFRFGNLYYKIVGYKGRELREYPRIKRVARYFDRTEAAFVVPLGMDPELIKKHEWLFRQMFGPGAELTCGEDSKTFVMQVYSTSVAPFGYDCDQVDGCIGKLRLPIYVGRSRSGDVAYDMVDYPHLLIAGETGSGKSVALRSVLTTLIRSVPELELYCADMKRSEFHLFRGIARDVVVDAAGLHKIVLKLRRELRKRGDYWIGMKLPMSMICRNGTVRRISCSPWMRWRCSRKNGMSWTALRRSARSAAPWACSSSCPCSARTPTYWTASSKTT
ncbi:DNA translocase FtsK [Paenibacillus sp. P1XP2]|nr:DNA translocase FtsK [Paenibacillus sp. P1XP2]